MKLLKNLSEALTKCCLILVGHFCILISIVDLVLKDRLVTYNMEDQTIGWTEYDCTYASLSFWLKVANWAG